MNLDKAEIFQDGIEVDRIDQLVGIRTIELDQTLDPEDDPTFPL